MDYEQEGRQEYAYDDAPRDGTNERAGSGDRRDDYESRRRSRSLDDRRSQSPRRERPAAENEGSNLFVTGLATRIDEEELKEVFGKYGEVEKSSIMLDPHTRESRGFGFVKFVLAEHADAAREALQGFELSGRTLNIERARRSRPRTPTPGKYYGPPKRDSRPRFDDRRRGGRFDDDRYPPRDRYGGGDRFGGGDRYGGDRYGGDRHGGDRYGGDRYGGDRYGGADRYADRGGDRYGSRRDRYDDRAYGGDYAREPAADKYPASGSRYPTEPAAAKDPYADDRYSRR